MKLVIDVDEEIYNHMKERFMYGYADTELDKVGLAVSNGKPQEPKWIPVSEKLPNFNDIVLASTDSDYDELRVILTVYSGEEFWFNGKIKAWMPLPTPYKAESEEKE